VTQSGPVEKQVQAWLDTIDASGPQTIQTMPASTIVPASRNLSTQRAAEFLAQLAERGRPVELRTGKVIGEGGMGVVREAEQVALGRTVAIKTLRAGRADPRGASDLLREAWVTGALEHPNVVPVHHLEIDEALQPLLILKRVDGVEWSALCHDADEVQRRFGATDLLAWNLGILGQVLNALRFAHARGVVHRDLKPSNVMIGNFGEVYLLDWGIAVATRDDGTHRFPLASEATEIAGTPNYMAPEMLGRGEGPGLSDRTDVYLAGAVLYELIAGHPPHQGNTAVAIMTSVVLSRPRIPREAPLELAQICLRAMQPDPADRHDSIEALQSAVQGYLEHRGSSRLAASATELADKLLVLAGERDPKRTDEIYRLLATCRFGFHQALAVWPDNADARTGITLATVAVAEYELACGDARAAVTLLSELEDRPPLLATAQAAAAAQATRHQALEALHRDSDPTVARATRMIVVSICFTFVILPLVTGLRPDIGLKGHFNVILWAIGCFVVVTVSSLLVRRRRSMTAINRRVFATGQFMFVAQAVLGIGIWQMGLPPTTTQLLNLLMWGAMCGMFALAVDRWLLLTTVGYFTAFLIAARYPEVRQFAVAGANLVLTLALAWRWRPAGQHLAAQRPRP
jgi:serine/threonine-protein kinase